MSRPRRDGGLHLPRPPVHATSACSSTAGRDGLHATGRRPPTHSSATGRRPPPHLFTTGRDLRVVVRSGTRQPRDFWQGRTLYASLSATGLGGLHLHDRGGTAASVTACASAPPPPSSVAGPRHPSAIHSGRNCGRSGVPSGQGRGGVRGGLSRDRVGYSGDCSSSSQNNSNNNILNRPRPPQTPLRQQPSPPLTLPRPQPRPPRMPALPRPRPPRPSATTCYSLGPSPRIYSS